MFIRSAIKQQRLLSIVVSLFEAKQKTERERDGEGYLEGKETIK